MIRAALTALHHDRDPAAALAVLDRYAQSFPGGTLHEEAMLARVHSLRALGRDDDVLALLARNDLARLPRGFELLVLRAELSMKKGQLQAAVSDFDAVLARGSGDDLLERALYGRAAARARAGELAGARTDLRLFLQRYPTSERADEVRKTLGN
jgi:tetratricopeptide (TPR) repeat protein